MSNGTFYHIQFLYKSDNPITASSFMNLVKIIVLIHSFVKVDFTHTMML